jgi:hypothetical protein
VLGSARFAPATSNNVRVLRFQDTGSADRAVQGEAQKFTGF